MNIEISESSNFLESVSSIGTIKGNRIVLKPSVGSGELVYNKIEDGLGLFVMEGYFASPLMFVWHYKKKRRDNYFVFNNQVDYGNISNSESALHAPAIEEGVSIFAECKDRRRLWLPNVQYKLTGIHFSKQWLENTHKHINLPLNLVNYISQHESFNLNIGFSADIKQVVNQMAINTLMLTKGSQNAYLKIKCIELMIKAFDFALHDVNTKKVKNSVHPLDMDAINDFVDDFSNELTDPPTLDDASARLGMSKSKMQRVFKKVVGMNYYKFVLKERMLKAMELLMNKQSVTQVAGETGYSSVGNFTNAFKNYFEMLPSDVK